MFRSDAAPTTSQGYTLALDSRYRANSLTFVDIYERGWKVAALRQQAITPSQSCRCGTNKSNWSRMRAACRKAVSVRLPGALRNGLTAQKLLQGLVRGMVMRR